MKDKIQERNFVDTARTKVGNFASKIGNAALASAGKAVGLSASKSRGRLSTRIIADELTHRWERYVASQKYAGTGFEGNIDDLYNYIRKYFGDDAVRYIWGEEEQPEQNQEPHPQSDEEMMAQQPPTFLNNQKNRVGGAPSSLEIPPVPFNAKAPVAPEPEEEPTPTTAADAVQSMRGRPPSTTSTAMHIPPSPSAPVRKPFGKRVPQRFSNYMPDENEYLPPMRNETRTVIKEQELKASEVEEIMLLLAAYTYASGHMQVVDKKNPQVSTPFVPRGNVSNQLWNDQRYKPGMETVLTLDTFDKTVRKLHSQIPTNEYYEIRNLLAGNGNQMRVGDITNRLNLSIHTIGVLFAAAGSGGTAH